ncbi:MAG: SDR family oxidoreductase [Chloroflexota bacterium]|jgi:NADP-dependent 3-hydroxy acid dehydrogenase YdfG|nr:oxidoreductase [Chloroflexota bacterium]MEC7788552.1 SDR family oxidoreductase [Chloroflexota bacterium]|tara:strand:+ start:2986 stop:3720 length:735 start_codon:yes stop_codon:yes gene_type:complete
MLRDLTGEVAWITGAGTGIGESGAIKLAEAGCKVILSGRRTAPLENVAAQIAGDVTIEPLDVSDHDDVMAVAERIIGKYGRIDIGVFSAGINIKDRNWPVVSIDDWNSVINIDLNGAFYCCQAVLPSMRKNGGGVIINVSSMAAKNIGMLTGPAYHAAKHAMNAMNASLIVEERNNGIRATALCPGEVATPILEQRPVPVSAEDQARILQSEDLGEVIKFIAQQPEHVTLNEILINPTWNRFQQ